MEKSINCPQPEAPGDILVVDDKVESLRTIEALLKEHGYKVRCIPDAKMALEVAADKPPGLMLLNVNMPGMNGFEVCRALKACPETRTFPILFLTPQTKRENLLKGFQAGGVDYITKPFLEQEVLTRVETHLTKGKAQHELAHLKKELECRVRQRTEELLKKTRLHQLMLDTTPAFFVAIKPTGEIITMNKALLKTLGYTCDEVTGKNFMTYIPEREHEIVAKRFKKLAGQGTVASRTTRLTKKNGSEIITVWHNGFSYNEKGELQLIFGFGEDITERKHLEDQLIKYREHLEILVKERTAALKERVKELNCLFSLSKIIEKPGVSIEEIFAEAVNLIPPSWQYPTITCGRLFYKSKEYKTGNLKKTKWKQTAKITAFGKNEGIIEVYYLEEKPHLYEGPFLKEERDLLNALAKQLGRVVERKQTENELLQNQTFLKKAQEKAEEANRLKSQFLANMSHDIRTPLNAVIGFTNLLAKSDMRNESRPYLDKIKTAGEGLLNLINDILDFSKIEAGQLDIFQRTFRVKTLLKSLRDIFEMQFQQKGVTLETRISPNVPEAVYNDKWRINQVLTNLLTNALKFTAKGNVTLYTGYREEQDLLVFRVTDTGSGIVPQSQDMIFDPFIQLDDTRDPSEKGAGLGLAICSKLVRLMGGTISVISTYGEGSEFTFEISANSQRVEAQTDNSAELETAETNLDQKTGNTILLVDDNLVNMELLIEQFKMAGFTNLLSAGNGKQAVEMAHEHSPDLILMDTQMPVMDGNQAIAQLKKEGYKGPIITLSGYVMREDIDKSVSLGAVGYITKPIDFSTFFDRIGAFLKEKAATLPATTPGINQPERETLQRYKIKESVTERIKNVFIQDLESNIEEISGAIEGGLGEGRTTIKHIAHGYKGNADYFGLSLLTTAAFELDRAIKKEEPDQTISTLSKNLLVILKEIHKHNT